MTLDFFSLPQVLGYATFLISMVAFAQKRDRHLKVWLIGQNLLYAAHFFPPSLQDCWDYPKKAER